MAADRGGSLIEVRAADDTLACDPATGALVSWRRRGTRRELIAQRQGDAVDEVGYVDAHGDLRTITDADPAALAIPARACLLLR